MKVLLRPWHIKEILMLVVTCPVCGASGDETDFHWGGQAHIARPATSDPAGISDRQQRDYLFVRHNPKGLHFERIRWDTMTMEFKAFYGVTQLPPEDVQKQAKGPWAEYFRLKAKTA
jgi:sarcosine oxidase, subunit delta